MRHLYITSLLVFAGFTASAQDIPANFKGSNPDPNAPVNVADPAQRPANPEVKSAIPAKGGQVFHVQDDKPAPDTRPRTRPTFPTELLPPTAQPAPQSKQQ